MTLMNNPVTSELIVREHEILTRIASGGPLDDVLRDLILLVERPSMGEMLASILIVSADGKRLLAGAAPSLPSEYNDAIHGIAIGPGVGSCGTAAHIGEPVIVSDIATDPLWDDFRDLALKHDLRACWSMPIKAADGSVLGTFANYYRRPHQPTERDLEVISMVARTAGIAIERYRYESARQQAEEQRTLLLHELNHRVKNVFALVGSLIELGARSASTSQELAATMLQRLNALGRAHELIQPDLSLAGGGEISDATFGGVLGEILAPYTADGREDRVVVTGPHVVLLPTAITGIALVLHELATNAVKYGSLKDATGALSIVWTLDGDRFRIIWSESTFSAGETPAKTGFGTRLTTMTVERQFHGMINSDWRRDGLTISIDIPATNILRL